MRQVDFWLVGCSAAGYAPHIIAWNNSLLDPIARNILKLLEARQKRAIEADEPQYALGSSVGSVRTSNEDVGVIVRRRGGTPYDQYDLAVVCDGMGGMKAGRRAASYAAATFISHVIRSPRHHPNDRLLGAIQAAHRVVLDDLQGQGGTTLSAVMTGRSGEAWIAQVGDTRVYFVDNGELTQLTRDQTLGAALQVGNEHRPDANRLLQFIGMDDNLYPEIELAHTSNSGIFLVTSDGAHGAQHELLRRVSRHAKSAPDLVRRFLSLADLLGGVDNATALVLPSQIEQGNEPTSAISLSIMTVAGTHDIWMVSDLNEIGSPRPPERIPAGGYIEAPLVPQEENPDNQASNKLVSNKKTSEKKTPAKKKRPAKNRQEVAEMGLPLDTDDVQVRLDFQDDGEGGNETS